MRGLAKLNPDTGASLSLSAQVTLVTGIAYGKGSLWLTNGDTADVVRLDAETGAIQATIPTGGRGDDLVVDGGLVWVVIPPNE